MYDVPLAPNCRLLAIDVNTGKLVWSILFHGGRSPAAVADGMLVAWNCYDAQIYCFGKGPSRTVLTASPKVAEGGSILIEGKVTDESPGTRSSNLRARFPNGVPAVADENMSVWMEYLYMQQPRPENLKGVPVKIWAVMPNGTSIFIGESATDPLNGGIFSLNWTPQEQGTYTIIAVFDGSDSYWGSYDSTAVAVISGASVAAPTVISPTEAIIITAVAVAIVIGIANLWAIRKLRK